MRLTLAGRAAGGVPAGQPPVLVMVSGYSRVIAARMIPSWQAGDLIDGHWQVVSGWRACPRLLVWDGESAAFVPADPVSGTADQPGELARCAGGYRYLRGHFNT